MLAREARRRSEGALEPRHIEFHSHGLGVFQRSCETFPGKPSASEDHEKNIGHFQRPKAGSNRWLIRQIGKFCRGCLAQKLSYGDRGIKDEFSHLRALFPPGVPEFQDLLDGQRLEALFAQFQARGAKSLAERDGRRLDCPHRHHPGHRHAAPGNGQLLAALHAVEQGGEMGLASKAPMVWLMMSKLVGQPVGFHEYGMSGASRR